MRMKTQNRLVILSTLVAVLAARAAIVPAPDDQEEPSVVANGNGYCVVWADKRSYDSTEYDNIDPAHFRVLRNGDSSHALSSCMLGGPWLGVANRYDKTTT